MSQRFALLIGHSSYQDDRLAVPHSAADVTALADALRDGQHGRFDNVHVLLDKTAVDLQLAIAAFLEQPLDADDLILLYFSGHCLFDGRDAFLAAADAFTEPYLDATTIQADFVRRRLNQCPARQLLMLDCVHSRLDGAPEVDAPRRLGHALGGPNRVVLVAAQTAVHTANFTRLLTDGLRGFAADSDRDGRLTVAEWFAYAQTAAPDNAGALWEKWAEPAFDQWVVTAVSPDKLSPPPVPPPGEVLPAATGTGGRRNGLMAALALLLLLLVGGGYALRANFAPSAAPAPTEMAAGAASATAVSSPQSTGSPTPQAATPAPTVEQTAATMTSPATSPAAAPTSSSTPAPTTPPTPAPSKTPAPPATATITPTPSVTSTPTVTPTPSATPTPIPMQITAEAAFLRAGPGVNYKIIAFPLQGTGVTAVARNSDATWYNVILEDDTSGWIYNDVVRPDDTAVGPTLPLAATIPAPLNEFYDFSAQDNGNTLVVQVYHVYVGTRGEDAFLRARLLPETDQVQPSYLNGDDLGLGLRIVAFSRTGSAPYTSTGVEFCMVDTTGEAFYCQTFPIRKEW